MQSCYENCLRLAAENGCRSVAFPSVSTGVYRFPLEKASRIAVRTVLEFLETRPDMEVRMVCFDRETLGYYENALKEQTELLQQEDILR